MEIHASHTSAIPDFSSYIIGDNNAIFDSLNFLEDYKKDSLFSIDTQSVNHLAHH